VLKVNDQRPGKTKPAKRRKNEFATGKPFSAIDEAEQ
jgi:hypothetical protein